MRKSIKFYVFNNAVLSYLFFNCEKYKNMLSDWRPIRRHMVFIRNRKVFQKNVSRNQIFIKCTELPRCVLPRWERNSTEQVSTLIIKPIILSFQQRKSWSIEINIKEKLFRVYSGER
jgi:hypothetical protein